VEKYVLLSNSHDGTLAVRVGFTPIRVVCANTLAMAHDSNASKLIRVKHSGNVVSNLEKIRETMNLADQEFETTAEQYRLLASREINTSDLEKYIKIVFATKKQMSDAEGNVEELNSGDRIKGKIINLFENGRGQNLPETRRTFWSAYQAVSEYVQYERGEDSQARLDNTWFGQGMQINKKALETAVTMVTLAA
jgi:phage/plasmid-like protein (TIGR03299 family)